MWISTFSWKTSSSYFGSTMISVMKCVKPSLWGCPSELPPSFLIQPTTPEKWLTCGQRKEEVSAPGTTIIDNASLGWFKIWNFNTTTTSEEWLHGREDMELNTSSVSGWLTVLVWCLTAMRHITPSNLNSPFSPNLFETTFRVT